VPMHGRHARRLEKVQMVRLSRAGRRVCVEPLEFARDALDALAPPQASGPDVPS
jgi:hypothetical protein